MDKTLIISTIGSLLTAMFLVSLPWFVEISIWIHLVLMFCAVTNSYLAGRGFAEIKYEWEREKSNRRHDRLLWYKQMGLYESLQLIDPKLADRYWIKI